MKTNNEFYDIRIPDKISFGAVGGPYINNEFITLSDGVEINIYSDIFSMKYHISYLFCNHQEKDEIQSFFRIVKGNIIVFRFKDWSDYQVENQLIGVGNGEIKDYQLFKRYSIGNFETVRNIYKPIHNTLNIRLGNSEVKENIHYKLENGLLQFFDPVKNNNEIYASFEFDVPVRFKNNFLPIKIDEGQKFSFEKIELFEVKL